MNTTRLIRLRRKNEALAKRNIILAVLIGLTSLIAVACMIFTAWVLFAKESIVNNLNSQVASLKEEVRNQTTEFNMLQSDYDNVTLDLVKMTEASVELDKQNKKLVDDINSQSEELESLRTRKELYDNYKYALIRDNGTRTDIKYDDIVTLEKLSDEKNMGDDAVTLTLAFSMTESQGTEKAKNPNSTASGTNQLLYSTAKHAYEDLMHNGKGTYKREYAFDASLNTQMALEYINELSKTSKNPSRIVWNYGGFAISNIDFGAYCKKLNHYLSKVGKNLNNLKF